MEEATVDHTHPRRAATFLEDSLVPTDTGEKTEYKTENIYEEKNTEEINNGNNKNGIIKNKYLSENEEEIGSLKTMADVVILAHSKNKEEIRKLSTTSDTYIPMYLHSDPKPLVSTTNDLPKMSMIQRIVIVTVLEDCIDQLFVLGKANSKPNVPPDLQYKSLKERFSERERTKIDLELKGSEATLTDSRKVIKLQKDRATIEMILQMTLDELKSSGTFKSLIETTETEKKKQNEEAELVREEEKNTKQVTSLQNTLKKELKEGMDKLNEKHEAIAELKDQIQDALFMNDLKFKYVSHWEKAREEQNSERLSTADHNLEEQLIDFRDNTDMELRCHVEIETYTKQAISNLENSIEMWMEKYDAEIERRDYELEKLKAKRATEYTALEDLVLLYQQRKNEIEAYLAHKEKEAAKAAHEAYLNRMATCIQAWWRGTMVRRGLGPYKKSKKGKDKKGKGKGGKKSAKK